MASEDIAARGDASERVRLLQLTLGIIVCAGPNDRKRVKQRQREEATQIFFLFVFALSPDYQAISAPRFFFCRRQKIFLLEKIPFAKANTPQPQTKCPLVCARVSHAARILERKTHFG
jgi:hypothetical protein